MQSSEVKTEVMMIAILQMNGKCNLFCDNVCAKALLKSTRCNQKNKKQDFLSCIILGAPILIIMSCRNGTDNYCTMSNFGPKKNFCALFLGSHWYTFKMCHPCQNLRQTGLEATGGPGGPSQPIQSIKID